MLKLVNLLYLTAVAQLDRGGSSSSIEQLDFWEKAKLNPLISAFSWQLEIWEPISSSLNHLIQNPNGAAVKCNVLVLKDQEPYLYGNLNNIFSFWMALWRPSTYDIKFLGRLVGSWKSNITYVTVVKMALDWRNKLNMPG